MGADTPQRRASDQPWRRRLKILVRENWYRDVWLTVITVLLIFAVQGQNNVLDDIQAGRKFSVKVTCTTVSAVIDAGRSTITGQNSQVDGAFARNLERLGYPPKPVREAQAKIAARQYAEFISRRVERATGAEGVVRADGTLNCEKLTRLARTD